MSVICRLNLSFVAMLVTALFVYLMFALMDDSWLIQKHSAPGPELGYLKSSNMSVEGKGRLEDKVNIGEHSHTNRETKENTERIGYTGWMSPEEFILQRDKPPNQTESTCTGCELKANCYTTKCKYHIQSLFTNCMTKCTLSNIVIYIPQFAANFWHPSKCPGIKRYNPRLIKEHPICKNASVLLIGDSRTRILFAAMMRKIYGNDGVVSTTSTSKAYLPKIV